MESQAIIDAIKDKPELFTEVFNGVKTLEPVKPLFQKVLDTELSPRIDEKTREIYGNIDKDFFDTLGVKPEEKEGKKEKTYDMVKRILADHKRLKDVEGSLTETEAVKKLTAEIEELKTKGGGAHWESVYNQAKTQFEQERVSLKERAEKAEGLVIAGQKGNSLANAVAKLSLNPDVDKSIADMVINTAKAELEKNSKIEGDKVIFLNAEGKPLLNSNLDPMSAEEALMSIEAIKKITLQQKTPGAGGGADPEIKGSIETKNVEGKDEQRLVLPSGFKSKLEFDQAADKALLDSGIARSDKRFNELKTKAYKEHEIDKLPRT